MEAADEAHTEGCSEARHEEDEGESLFMSPTVVEMFCYLRECVTLVAADASTLSAVRSDVSYAAPDTGYTWTETDTPEITGTSHAHNSRPSRCVAPPLCCGRVLHLICAGRVLHVKRSMLV